MPAVDSIRIRGFKSIRDLEVELRPVNVLIGANGSGKPESTDSYRWTA